MHTLGTHALSAICEPVLKARSLGNSYMFQRGSVSLLVDAELECAGMICWLLYTVAFCNLH